jgi:hypothetical protein
MREYPYVIFLRTQCAVSKWATKKGYAGRTIILNADCADERESGLIS